jgi:Ser/Thr protein kinase RdoA (MazF antagonist)
MLASQFIDSYSATSTPNQYSAAQQDSDQYTKRKHRGKNPLTKKSHDSRPIRESGSLNDYKAKAASILGLAGNDRIDFHRLIIEKKNQETREVRSRKLFFIKNEERPYVFRMFSRYDSVANREKELLAVRTTSENGVGPKLVGAPSNNEFYIIEFIKKGIEYGDLNEAILSKIGETIAKVHGLNFDLDCRSHLDRIRWHYVSARRKGVALPDKFGDLIQKHIERQSDFTSVSGFCHGDLKLSNIRMRDDGSIIIVDWARSGRGNVFEDLGYFVKINGLTEDQMRIFLRGYFGREASNEEIENIRAWADRACLLISTIWFDFSETKKEKEVSIQDRKKNLEELAASGNLDSVADYARTNRIPNTRSFMKDQVKRYAMSAFLEYGKRHDGCNFLCRVKKWFTSLF